VAAEKGKGKVARIVIHMHHGADEANEGFHVEHEYEQSKDGEYQHPTHEGVMKHHGEVMHHVHEQIKKHGSEEPHEDEHSCDTCGDPIADEEARKKNITTHGYEKGSPNGPGPAKSKAHPGFKAVAKKIESKEGVTAKAAGAILAARTRSASPAAHKANSRLSRVG
jgi:hypothetical protein